MFKCLSFVGCKRKCFELFNSLGCHHQTHSPPSYFLQTLTKYSTMTFLLLYRFLMTLEFMGLMGMLTQSTLQSQVGTSEYMCFVILVSRFFGLSSGCVAMVLAIERYYALTKPFLYCKHFTNGLVRRLVLTTVASCAVLTFAPIFGVGIFRDTTTKTCQRYRDADQPLDIAYAFIFFFFGKLA